LKEADVLRVAAKVRTSLDNEIQTLFPKKFGAKVAISFVDGTVCQKRVLDPKGSNAQPFSPEELKIKFRAMTRGILSDKTIEFIINNIDGLEHASDLSQLPLNDFSGASDRPAMR
jgi:2-methylcitrate dehydratase PrpD